MSTSPVFEWLATEMAARTHQDALQSRGTLRLALHNAGIEVRSFSKDEAFVVIGRLLPGELKLRGFSNAQAICAQLEAALRVMTFARTGHESAEAAFARLGRR